MAERYDAALLDVYGYKEEKCPPTASERPHKRGRLVIAAARELYESGQVEHFVFSGGPALGRSEPISTLAAEDLIRKSHIDPENVTTNPSADVTTSNELKTLKNELSDNRWVNSVSIGWELHKKAIKNLAKKRLNKNTRHKVLSAEEILARYPNERNARRYARVIDAIHNSESERRFQEYENRMHVIMRLPFAVELLDILAKFYRPKAD